MKDQQHFVGPQNDAATLSRFSTASLLRFPSLENVEVQSEHSPTLNPAAGVMSFIANASGSFTPGPQALLTGAIPAALSEGRVQNLNADGST